MKKRKLLTALLVAMLLISSNFIWARDNGHYRGGFNHHRENRTIVYERHVVNRPVVVERRVIVERPRYYEAPRPHFYLGFGVLWGNGPWLGSFTIGNNDVCLNTRTGIRRIAIPERGRYVAYDDVIVVHDTHGKVWVRRR